MRRLPVFLAAGAVAIALAGSAVGLSLVTRHPAAPSPLQNNVFAAAPVATTTTSGQSDSWTSYHRDAAHSGYDPLTPAFRGLNRAWVARLDGKVYASPLLVDGVAVVATENDSLYGLDPHTGKTRWRDHLGSPVHGSDLPCGNIDPLGITGTPAYDQRTRRVYAVTTTRNAGRVVHTLVGVDSRSGKVDMRRGVDVANQDPTVMNQRSALTVTAGRVYVAYGGHAGDCGNYHGIVVSVQTDGRGALGVFRVPAAREGGIWASGGLPVDSHGDLYASVGNGSAGQDSGAENAPYDGSDSVTELTKSLHRVGSFAPAGWRSENSADADLGSTGPQLVGRYVWIQGKAGTGYVLKQGALGGIGGQVSSLAACARQFGGAATLGMTVFAPCTDGVRQILISSTGGAKVGWHASSKITGSPVIGGGVVFSLDVSNGVLYALDTKTGRVRGKAGVGPVTRFATPALDGSLVLVPTAGGVTALSEG